MNCGAVMQDTFIFNDTIAGNISESEQNEIIDRKYCIKQDTLFPTLFVLRCDV